MYDNLNRMTASPNAVYENDLLGNRTWRNRTTQGGLPAQRLKWDIAGRLQSACGPSAGAKYEYRADGMRTKKVEGLTLAWHWDDEEQSSGFWDENWNINKPTTRYWYDGQMPIEEDSKRKDLRSRVRSLPWTGEDRWGVAANLKARRLTLPNPSHPGRGFGRRAG